MNSSRSNILAVRTLALVAAIAASASVASAQSGLRNFSANAGAFSVSKDRIQTTGEHDAWRAARSEPRLILRDIDMSAATERQINDVQHDFDGRLDALRDQGNADANAGRSDPAFVSRINGIRLDQREAQRCQLAPSQQAQYDRNTMGNMTSAKTS